MIISRVKFYADANSGIKNKYFCYSCDELHFQEFFNRQFAAGLSIRAAWFEKIEMPSKKILENIRFKQSDINSFMDHYSASYTEKMKIEASRALDTKKTIFEALLNESKVASDQINEILNSFH